MTEPAAVLEPQATVHIDLASVQVVFPPEWWDQPSNAVIVTPQGDTLRDVRIDTLAAMIAARLKQLDDARKTSPLIIIP